MSAQDGSTTAAGKPLWIRGLQALVGSNVVTLVIRWAGLAIFAVPDEFLVLTDPVPTIFWTTVGVVGAVGVYAVLGRVADRPNRMFLGIAVGVLVASFIPDFWLLTEGASDTFPGATPAGVGILLFQHVAAAVVIVWSLTRGSAKG